MNKNFSRSDLTNLVSDRFTVGYAEAAKMIDEASDTELKIANATYLYSVIRAKVKSNPKITVEEWYQRLYRKPELRGQS